MGADPVACAALAGGFEGKAFFVRKEVKAHGLARRIEGPLLDADDRCVVVEDVVSTGGSTLTAIAALQEAGHTICGVISVLDRLSGGREAIEAAAGAPYVALSTIDDVYPERRGRSRGRDAPARSRTWICRLGGGRLVHWTTRARRRHRVTHARAPRRRRSRAAPRAARRRSHRARAA